jgi:hypothetical protein
VPPVATLAVLLLLAGAAGAGVVSQKVRSSRTRLQGMASHVKGMGMQATSMAANATAMDAIGRTTQVLT